MAGVLDWLTVHLLGGSLAVVSFYKYSCAPLSDAVGQTVELLPIHLPAVVATWPTHCERTPCDGALSPVVLICLALNYLFLSQ